VALKVTPRRLDLLAWVDDMEIWQESNGHSVRTLREVFGVSEVVEQVSQEMADIEAAGWAVVVEGRLGARYWVLTDAGREALGQPAKKG
jgi:hypothetical protein